MVKLCWWRDDSVGENGTQPGRQKERQHSVRSGGGLKKKSFPAKFGGGDKGGHRIWFVRGHEIIARTRKGQGNLHEAGSLYEQGVPFPICGWTGAISVSLAKTQGLAPS